MVNKIKISMEQVLLYSKLTVKSGEDAGKLVLERNLDRIKEWTDDEISEIFDADGNLKRTKRMKTRSNLIKTTRFHTITALRLIIKEKFEDSGFKLPTSAEYKRMAKDLVSEENIRNAFEESSIIYNPYQIY